MIRRWNINSNHQRHHERLLYGYNQIITLVRNSELKLNIKHVTEILHTIWIPWILQSAVQDKVWKGKRYVETIKTVWNWDSVFEIKATASDRPMRWAFTPVRNIWRLTQFQFDRGFE